MVKRLLDCNASDFAGFSKEELLESIKAAEGRTVCSEMVAERPSVGGNLTNAEVAKAFGADLMLLNGFDVLKPVVYGVDRDKETIQELKRLVGRPIGCNLEPVDLDSRMLEERIEIPKGRITSEETFRAANELGIDFICLTGNPGTGVSNQEIYEQIKLAKQIYQGIIIAGKMHGAGTAEPVLTVEVAKQFIEAGADILLTPAVGTIPGFNLQMLTEIVEYAHQAKGMVMTAIGTSQETSSPHVVEDMAIQNKIAGVDIQHIGDAGYGGLANVDNIYTLSAAIRGHRHTINRIASSVVR
ncbi:haloacid dehalogenase-like hydrolase [Facklamia sp. DSM 111018]|uniref:Haloacid dehalogenase-like hydrolase n=1 Tax=Facklamia lactis TaxID=2749967 RepID=A0ABS0LTG9_9LACT|nr:haloacid dehalogenase-like hydrolase [Facklamia lactis]MBG9979459.1 haloacid dehalogenase-like hydrolase [Facklamia lactis]MBG9987324.1 haloacid dehalogenase-like hydrolase [Facklamia lactis]